MIFVEIKRFLRDVAAFRPLSLATVILLMLARSLSESVTFLSLLPLLAAAGIVSHPDASGGSPRWQEWIESVSAGQPISLSWVLLLFLTASAARAVLGFSASVAAATFTSAYVHQLRCDLYRAFSRASWLYGAASREAEDANALSMQTELTVNAIHYALGIVSCCFTILAGLIAAVIISAEMTFVTVLILAALLLPFTAFLKWSYAGGAASLTVLQHLYAVLVNRVSGLKLAKSFAIERELEADFAARSKAYADVLVSVRRNGAAATLAQEAGATVALVALVYTSLSFLQAPGLDLVILVAIFARVAPIVGSTQSSVNGLLSVLPSYTALRKLEDRARRSAEHIPRKRVAIPLKRSVSLHAVSFTYPGTQPPALRDVSLQLAAHTAVGIIGKSGSGKSTLADMIAGLLAPDEGSLLVDDLSIDSRNRASWRASVGYLPQNAPLFNDTLRANLCLGKSDATDAELWSCLELVHAADLVHALPSKLDTLAGEGGVRFSGGERQRLRLASALLRRPQLLILDESTSALSPADEQSLIGSLRPLSERITIMIIAHRPSSVLWTDRLLVLDGGRIVRDARPSQALIKLEEE